MRFSFSTSLLLAGALAAPAFSQATPLTTVRVAAGLARPLWLGQSPGETNPNRLFTVEQKQADIHIILNGVVQEPPFLDLTNAKVATGGNEQGLLGLAFHPDFLNNGWFYIDYTRAGDGFKMIERYTVIGDPATATQADPTSNVVILGPVTHPQTNHNGGNIAFGPDGKLYSGLGDGGNANDMGAGHIEPTGNAQNGTVLLGKMLRMNDDGSAPTDNPFASSTDGIQDLIWQFGMRNPWRWSFDAETGDLWIGDVGQDLHEEIDFQPAGQGGKNFGWRCMEGFSCTGLTGCVCNAPALTLPIHDYSHSGGKCSVTGGYIYRGKAIPDLAGNYFFADYCTGQVWSLKYDGVAVSNFTERTAELAPGGGLSINQPTSFGVDNNNEIYIVDQVGGEIYKIIPKSAFTGLGEALPGAAGKPILWAEGSFSPNGTGTIHLDNAAPSAATLFFVGLTVGATPFKGGTLVPVPFILDLNFNTTPSGEIDLPYFVDPIIPVGTTIVFQYAIQDAGAINGVALSNALKGVTTP